MNTEILPSDLKSKTHQSFNKQFIYENNLYM